MFSKILPLFAGSVLAAEPMTLVVDLRKVSHDDDITA